MRLIVGCPTKNRTWILPLWRQHVESSIPKDWDVEYLFVVGDDDGKTIDLLNSWTDTTICYVSEPPLMVNRSWGNPERFHHMVYIRNILLENIRSTKPDLFLSLDSDILIDPNLISSLYETMQQLDVAAVGGLTWLDPVDEFCTNICKWTDNFSTYKRIINPGTHLVDIIMAIKLMSPAAYNVDYEYHKCGEDLGWNINIRKAGLQLACDGRFPSKHVMSENWISKIDKRIGW